MFAIPGQPILSLSEDAARRLRDRLADGHRSWVRIGVRRGGCAGMEYTMDFAEAPEPQDETLEQDGVRLAIAPTATLFLVGTRIDYRSGLLESGFSFTNPNVAESCGCGESVRFSVGENTPEPVG